MLSAGMMGKFKEAGKQTILHAAKIGAHAIDRKKKRGQLLGARRRQLLTESAKEKGRKTTPVGI
jgi:hypothetical protein